MCIVCKETTFVLLVRTAILKSTTVPLTTATLRWPALQINWRLIDPLSDYLTDFSSMQCELIFYLIPAVSLLICLPVCLSVFLSVCLSFSLSVCLSFCLSVYLSICFLIHWSNRLAISTALRRFSWGNCKHFTTVNWSFIQCLTAYK